ncbi:MAG: glycoside hydrolase family 3 C-terminal domain-containing protein [Clostridiales bacterium]|nr:glycoside hydrolase family 3 C-terminal domain-containing protein [Clostridiales bacterium]
MTKKRLVRLIALPIVAVILIAIMIVVNYFLNYYALIIHRFLAGDTTNASGEETLGALAAADEVVQDAAAESIVLLENKDGFLPLNNLEKVNLFGWGATDAGFLLTGGGSGGTTITDSLEDGTPRIKIDLTDAFKQAGIEYNVELTRAYESFSSFDADYRSGGSTGANATQSLLNPDASFYSASLMDQAYSYSKTAVAVISRWGCENGGENELKSIGSYQNGDFLRLTAQEKAMFDKLQDKGFDVIVLLNVCNNIELGFVEEYSCIKACLHVGIPGQSGTMAIPKIITGEINPSGRTSDTLAYDYSTNNPVYVNAVKNGNDLTYQEGIYFGYKWYETAAAEGLFNYDEVVQYPFGYGLSYTTFSWRVQWFGETALTKDGQYTVKVTVTNTGDVAGKDVVQLYGHAPYINGGIEKAERILLDFAKTPLIDPGKSETVELTFKTYELASYDDYDRNSNGFKGYELDASTADNKYEIALMSDSHTKLDSREMNVTSNIQYAKDPVTGEKVGNLFTGSDAYANMPIDGSAAFNTAINYLSRKDKFANMPKQSAGTSNNGKVNAAINFRYAGYNDKDVSFISYGNDVGLFLVGVQGENDTVTKASAIEMLNGADTSVNLVYNKEIIELFVNYDNEDNPELWDLLLNQLTQDDVKNLIGLGGFQTTELLSIGKPRAKDMDGPAGFNNNVSSPGKSSPYTLFPSESLLGCSWSKEVAYSVGEAQAKIASSMGVNGWYGPGVNLHRSVYNSRNYEYFSEDAVLSGKLATEMIVGAKENNLYCYLKHFAVSEAGQNPKNLNTWLTEQNLRENYLKAFEIAVKGAKANAMMSAFNRVGATLCGYNHALLTDVLRTEWGFRGSVITDWYEGSGYMSNHELGILAGNDLWLCGTTQQPADLDLSKPEVAYAARQSVKNILYTYISTNATSSGIKVNPEAHSNLFDALWIIINIVLSLGIAACVIFAVLPFVLDYINKRKALKQTSGHDSSQADTPHSDKRNE